MTRKDFFKKLGLGALVVAIAPKMLAKEEKIYPIDDITELINSQYDIIPKELITPEDYFNEFCILDDIWPSRLWTEDKTDYIDLSG